jgi:uncharacterized membrane protein (DUF4010 family)
MQFDVTVAGQFLLVLAIGALVGIEREKHKASQPASFGGVRTFILLAQLGAVASWLSLHLQTPWLFALTVLAVAATMLTAYVLQNRLGSPSLGLTSELSAITVCLLGGAVIYGYAELAVSLAIVTSAVLTFKQPLHGLVDKIGTDDLVAALKLLIATFIVLPLLPNQTIDPWQAFNPYKIWLLVVLISALSLVGYIAGRMLGPARGTAVAGLAGGLASSTAVTLSFARLSRDSNNIAQADALAAGILLAWSVMGLRVLLMVGLLSLPLFLLLWPVVLTMTALTFVYAFWCYRHAPKYSPGQSPLSNPFNLWAATQFALLFALVLLVVKLTEHFAPAQGMYLVAMLAGTTDVDAITLSMVQYGSASGELMVAATAVLLAIVSNTLVKLGLVSALGGAELRRQISKASGLILASALLGWWAWL